MAEGFFPDTAVYMQPESMIEEYMLNREINVALNIWSIRCIILEMITEEPFWECQNLSDLPIKVGFSGCTPKIPKTMSSTDKDFLMKCFQMNPSVRWIADMSSFFH
ncbi:hypothetical protein PTKIN_Ptkin12aG0030600 [Pterospermum kingtungense]